MGFDCLPEAGGAETVPVRQAVLLATVGVVRAHHQAEDDTRDGARTQGGHRGLACAVPHQQPHQGSPTDGEKRTGEYSSGAETGEVRWTNLKPQAPQEAQKRRAVVGFGDSRRLEKAKCCLTLGFEIAHASSVQCAWTLSMVPRRHRFDSALGSLLLDALVQQHVMLMIFPDVVDLQIFPAAAFQLETEPFQHPLRRQIARHHVRFDSMQLE